MNVSVFIGRRLSFRGSDDETSSSRRRGSSAGVPIAVGGIALSIVIMMVSVAVVLGFKDEIRRKVTGFNSEITMFPQSRTLAAAQPISLSGDIKNIIESTLPGARYTGVVEMPGILKTDSAFQGVIVKAYTPDADGYRFIESNITEGTMPEKSQQNDTIPSQPRIVISSVTSDRLGLVCGDKVDVHFVNDGNLKTRRAVISGIYDTHLGEYDSRYVFADQSLPRKVSGIADSCFTSVEINNIPQEEILESCSRLSAALLDYSAEQSSRKYIGVDNVLRSGQAYFSWLDLLDTNVVVILVLMSLVSGFTLISSLFILILERVRTIGILKSLGATNAQIRGVFVYMAERLVVRGLLIGNIIAFVLIFVQYYFQVIPLDAESYFLSFVPVSVNWSAILLLNASAIVLSAVILILPSHMIATLSPSESMRYE